MSVSYTLIEKTAPKERVNEWYSKLGVYELWEAHYLSIGGNVTVWNSPDGEPVRMTVDEYNESCKTGTIPDPVYRVLEKTTDMNNSYLWSKTPKKDKDELDKLFESDRSKFIKVSLYGLHTYGGYYGFFRPDLTEVINLIEQSSNPLLYFDTIERIYVTTSAHPSDNINDCYDSKADRHKAETTCYVMMKQF
jgi:hypothetical protein